MKFAYIYNSEQGIWFIKQGLIPVDFGTGNKGDAFMKFLIDEKYQSLFSQWCNKCKNKSDFKEIDRNGINNKRS